MLCRVLCEGGADIGVRKKDGASAVHSAVKHGHIESLKGTRVVLYYVLYYVLCCLVLIENGAQIKGEVVKGMSLMHTAAQHGHEEIVQFLLDIIKVIHCYCLLSLSFHKRHLDSIHLII